jgi:ATP-dependent Zn protease
MEIHERMAKALLERETLNSNDIDEIMAGSEAPVPKEIGTNRTS